MYIYGPYIHTEVFWYHGMTLYVWTYTNGVVFISEDDVHYNDGDKKAGGLFPALLKSSTAVQAKNSQRMHKGGRCQRNPTEPCLRFNIRCLETHNPWMVKPWWFTLLTLNKHKRKWLVLGMPGFFRGSIPTLENVPRLEDPEMLRKLNIHCCSLCSWTYSRIANYIISIVAPQYPPSMVVISAIFWMKELQL